MYQVYRNLHTGTYSIRDSHTGLVCGHALSVTVIDPYYHVSLKGVERIRKEKKKYVVAWIEGRLANVLAFKPFKDRTIVTTTLNPPVGSYGLLTFNPYRSETFTHFNVSKGVWEHAPQNEAHHVILTHEGQMLKHTPIKKP